MKVTLPDFRRAGVLVVGDVMLDRYWYGPTNRISPEAPVPVVKVDTIEERPGGAANVAMNIASLGAVSRLVGLTGIDDAARALSAKLNEVNVRCDFVSVPTHPTITKLRVLSRNQQLIRLDFEEGFDGVDPQPMIERIQQALPNIGALVLSDYAKGALTHVQTMIQTAKAAGVPVLIDPKGTDFSRYRGATLLTPNLSEFEAVVGRCKNEQELVERGMRLVADYQLSALLITRSEQGMTLLQPGKAPLNLPTQAQEVYDVTGAGDTVIGVLAAALAAGNPLEEACFLANAAAGVVVGKLGTSTVTPIELENAIRGRSDSGFGVMSEEQLKDAVARARQRGEKIVMTNGCFDILHAGHVSYLANARKLGDRLIVAVNSDASTKRLKGPTRPVNPLPQRMIVLGALESVDWVVAFEEDTPQRLIAEVLPDILVKGGDYQPHEIAGSEEVWANGGEVKVLNFEDGCSTTNIINAIKAGKSE
ncbi:MULTISPECIES: bifunctional D-glycero-beta-D-manno-heptose-7-phosphate kinase/D-glycero-beta-D-manno-heptose 1-phosphate adenylyltransferase HldE [unclassified Brenneria]|uniref:bifunctional D-glycero-beta-D-manno-heptose-7-phosphate kinase/D-glycero-beta-D-manno-heptose 1-phosphate adenylyltransferase HldE n=1 Tax=unclassified Brenneria TaxID=2634434 RepID=UPI0029C34215|nr:MULTISPECIES: bifunctional D-glycero-beta-D-manno-heptose-7-phosphate kinase/D-glycero-beta-D-manno-heptose 1-phosphate adenylyltransferase HldE [unclassified Brenneria]MDX5628837.1 bifunctional D-glycero-beta-D-manno-heptose-7-phosphate kinase/D-glycero-beta-D-manno-heptose 1-phosphate adenylyltransferase HldE [Brenneria sp. L3-3Z]MDX5695976.1 bifunctional D-glycero-beta-D-manno-heptose-7-phosphate kinase/D-glycero-beta-D-manno-heptose 1-phosphate adenylyltransferase HldE [Brenneria sp. L4-2C